MVAAYNIYTRCWLIKFHWHALTYISSCTYLWQLLFICIFTHTQTHTPIFFPLQFRNAFKVNYDFMFRRTQRGNGIINEQLKYSILKCSYSMCILYIYKDIYDICTSCCHLTCRAAPTVCRVAYPCPIEHCWLQGFTAPASCHSPCLLLTLSELLITP